MEEEVSLQFDIPYLSVVHDSSPRDAESLHCLSPPRREEAAYTILRRRRRHDRLVLASHGGDDLQQASRVNKCTNKKVSGL